MYYTTIQACAPTLPVHNSLHYPTHPLRHTLHSYRQDDWQYMILQTTPTSNNTQCWNAGIQTVQFEQRTQSEKSKWNNWLQLTVRKHSFICG